MRAMDLFSRSAALNVHVKQRKLYAGDTLVGIVKLTMRRKIRARELCVRFTGEERLQWVESSTRSTDTHYKYHPIVSLTVLRILPESGEEREFMPGEYRFAFTFQLPSTFPASFAYSSSSVGMLSQVDIFTRYRIQAKLVRGIFKSDLRNFKDLWIKPSPESVALPTQAKPIMAYLNEQVHLLGLFNRGVCHVRLEMRSTVLDVFSIIQVTVFIYNESRQKLTDLRVILYEDITVDYNRDGKCIRDSRARQDLAVDQSVVRSITNGKPIMLTLPITTPRPTLFTR